MLIQTHKVFANILQEEFKYQLSLDIDNNYFVFGNILPDIAPKYVSQKHFLYKSLDLIIDKADELINVESISSQKFAVSLGIITHYLCDFFCEPHNNRSYYKSKINEHMIYEKKLHTKVNKNFNFDESKFSSVITNSIQNYILKMSKEYGDLPPSIDRDIEYALNVSKTVALYIILNSKYYLNLSR